MGGPFPVRRLLILPWAISAWTLTLHQAAAQALPSAVVACIDEHDPTKRLACYDREVPRAVAAATKRSPSPSSGADTAALGAQPTSVPSSGTPGRAAASASSAKAPQSTNPQAPGASAPTTPSEVDAFGMTAQIQRKENGAAAPPHLDKLTAHITAVSQRPGGESIVTLDNGQVWEEAEATAHLPLRAGDNVTIKHGVLGAFYMSSQQVLGLRVKRVR